MRRIQSTHFDLQLKLDSSNSSNTLLHWGTKQVVLLATWLSCCVLLVLLLISEQHLLPSINRHTSKSVRPAQFTKYTRFLRQSSSMSSTQAVHQDQSTVKLASEEPQIDELWNAMPFTKVVKAEGARYDYQHEPSHSNELHQQSAYHETLQQAGVTQQQQQQHQRPPLQLPHLSFLSDRDIIILLDYIRELNAYNITPEAATAGYLQAFETVTPLFHDSPWQVKNSAKAWQQQQQPSGFASHDLANARGNGALGSSSSSSSSSAVHQYSQTQNATNAAEQLMTYALLLLKASHKLVHCGTEDSSMPPLLPHQQRDRLLLAAVLSEGSGSSSAAAAAAAGRRGGGVTGGFTKADDAMPNFVLQVVTFALQYPSESLFVSIVHDTGGSSDSSEGDSSSSVVSFWLDVLQLLLLPLRVPVLVSKTSDVMQQQWGLGASGVEQQAALRNLALDPFVQLQHKGNSSSSSSSGGSSCAHSSSTSGDAVVQSNDSTPAAATAQQLAACFDPEWLLFVDGGVLFCKSDLHRIMMHDQADLACGWDLRMAEPAPIPAAAAGHNVGSSSSSTDNTAAAAAAAVRQDEPNVIDPAGRNDSSSVMNAAESHVDPNVAAAVHKADYSSSKSDAQTTSLQPTGLTAPAAAAGTQRHLQQQQQQTVQYGVLSINQLQQQQQQQHHQAQPTSTPAATAAQATTAQQQQQQQQQRQRFLAVPPSGRPSLHTLLQYPFYYGDAAVGRLVTGGLFDVVPPYAAAAHMPTQSRLAAGLPVQVHCCWSGFAKTRAEPFRRGLRFRSHQPSECKTTTQNLMCDDLHRLGFSKVLIDSGVLVTRQLQLSARISNNVKQGRRMPYIRRSRWLEVQGAGSPWFQGHQNHHHHQQQQQDERSRFSTCCESPTERFGMSSSSSSSSNADDVVGGAVSKLGLSDSLSNILYAVGFGNSKGNQQLNTVNRFSREGFSDRQYRVHQSPSGALTLQEFLRAALMQSGKATVADLGLYSSSGTKGATAAVEGTEAEAQCRLMDILARNFTEGYLWQARQRQQQEVV